MNLNVTGKNIQITEGLRGYVSKKMERVKYYFPHLIDVHVVMEVEKIIHKIEITIKADGKVFHSEFKGEDMYESIDKLIDRVEGQIRRYKDKLHDFKSKKVSEALAEKSDNKTEIVFTKVREIMPKAMLDEEAITQLSTNLFKFHIYKNAQIHTEEEYKQLKEKNIPFLKSVAIKENGFFVIIRKLSNGWEKETVKMVKNQLKSEKVEKNYKVDEISIEDAVKNLIDLKEEYHIFYDKDHKNLNIVYRRKDNTLGLITSNTSVA